jgi:hypothetical protein
MNNRKILPRRAFTCLLPLQQVYGTTKTKLWPTHLCSSYLFYVVVEGASDFMITMRPKWIKQHICYCFSTAALHLHTTTKTSCLGSDHNNTNKTWQIMMRRNILCALYSQGGSDFDPYHSFTWLSITTSKDGHPIIKVQCSYSVFLA